MIPTKEEFKEWYGQKFGSLTRTEIFHLNEVYSFFSSSNDRVVEEIRELKPCIIYPHTMRDEDIAYSVAIEDVLSLIQPKEDIKN